LCFGARVYLDNERMFPTNTTSINVRKGQTVTLICNGRTIKWRVPKNYSNIQVLNEKLTITSIIKDNSGKYECQGENEHGYKFIAYKTIKIISKSLTLLCIFNIIRGYNMI